MTQPNSAAASVKVYVVMCWWHIDTAPNGVFSTREKAEEFIRNAPMLRDAREDSVNPPDWYTIEEFEIDQGKYKRGE